MKQLTEFSLIVVSKVKRKRYSKQENMFLILPHLFHTSFIFSWKIHTFSTNTTLHFQFPPPLEHWVLSGGSERKVAPLSKQGALHLFNQQNQSDLSPFTF